MKLTLACVLLCLASIGCAVRGPARTGNVKIVDRVEFIISLLPPIEGKDGKMHDVCDVIGYRTYYTDGTQSVEYKRR